MTTPRELFGQDVALDESMQARVAASGELILTDGLDTASQDVRLRLFTPLGELFYDVEFGSLVLQWIREESTDLTRAGLCDEINRRVELDAAVQPGSVDCQVLAWDHESATLKASYRLIDEDHPFNLVISLDAQKGEAVIADVDPRP